MVPDVLYRAADEWQTVEMVDKAGTILKKRPIANANGRVTYGETAPIQQRQHPRRSRPYSPARGRVVHQEGNRLPCNLLQSRTRPAGISTSRTTIVFGADNGRQNSCQGTYFFPNRVLIRIPLEVWKVSQSQYCQ